MRRGFSLVEVIMALLILQVGVLATLTLTISALHTLRRAEDLERSISAIRLVADSLGAAGGNGVGQTVLGPVVVRWRPAAGAGVDAEALVSGSVRLRVRLPYGGSP